VEKSERLTFPPRLEIRQKSPDFHIPTAPTATLTSQLPKRLHIPLRPWLSVGLADLSGQPGRPFKLTREIGKTLGKEAGSEKPEV